MDFNEIAGMWDTERRIKRAKQISDFILSQIDIDKNSVLLDFGCGTGLISQNMINHVSKVIGYDQSEKMLEIFDSKFFDIKDKVISTNTLDDFNECIDIVLSSMVFHHIEDIDCTMQYLRKSLKVNGKLMIIDLDKDDGSFHKDEIDFKGNHGFYRK